MGALGTGDPRINKPGCPAWPPGIIRAHQCAPQPACTRRRWREQKALRRLRTGCSAMMRLLPRRVPLPMRARSAYVSSPSHSRGPETPFHCPHCGHALHLACVAHLVANVRDLRCPTCRARWPPEAANAFTTACHAHGVEAPQPAPDHDTTSRQCHNSMAPRPPSHILPFCCPRLFLADSAHATSDAAWQELPDRHMHWAPIHSRQSGRWRPEWVCMRCNATFDEDHPLLQHVPEPPTCPAHRPRRLAPDLCEFSRGWVCCRGSPPEVLPCPGERVPLPDPLQPPLVGGAPEQPALVSTAPSTEAAWFNQGPPDNLAAGNTNSWLLVPLLHAAVGRLQHSVLAAWEAHVHYALLWRGALGTLRQAPPVAPAALVHALHTLQQLVAQEGRAEAELLLTLAAEANLLPDNTSVHLLWAWQIVTHPSNRSGGTATCFHGGNGRVSTPARSRRTASRESRPPMQPNVRPRPPRTAGRSPRFARVRRLPWPRRRGSKPQRRISRAHKAPRPAGARCAAIGSCFGKGSRNKAAENVASCDATQASIWSAKGGEASQGESPHVVCRHIRIS